MLILYCVLALLAVAPRGAAWEYFKDEREVWDINFFNYYDTDIKLMLKSHSKRKGTPCLLFFSGAIPLLFLFYAYNKYVYFF